MAARFPEQKTSIGRFFECWKAAEEAIALIGEEHDSWWWFLHTPSLPLRLWPLIRDARRSLAVIFDEIFGSAEAPKIALAANLPYYSDDPARLWWLFFAVAQGGYVASGASYIRGGSGALSARLVGVIEEEAGVARAGRLVTTIHLDNHGRAAGVTHCAADGSDAQEVRAPVLLGNAAPPVLAEALPSETREAFLERYIGLTPSISLYSIALGLDQRPREFGFTHYSTVLLPDWLGSLADYARSADLLADHPSGRIPVMVAVDYSAIDSGLNPDGPHLVTLVGVDRVANWQELDGDAYDQKREAWLDAIVADVDRTFPGFATAIVQREIATAATMQRYLNTPEDALYGFAAEPPECHNGAGLAPQLGMGLSRYGSEKTLFHHIVDSLDAFPGGSIEVTVDDYLSRPGSSKVFPVRPWGQPIAACRLNRNSVPRLRCLRS